MKNIRPMPRTSRIKAIRKIVGSRNERQIRRMRKTVESINAQSLELDALTRDPERIPFQDGLPPELEASLRPYREELERVFCSATGELEIMQTVKTGLWYDHR